MANDLTTYSEQSLSYGKFHCWYCLENNRKSLYEYITEFSCLSLWSPEKYILEVRELKDDIVKMYENFWSGRLLF